MQFFSDLLNQRIRWCSPCGTSTGYGALYNWWAATGYDPPIMYTSVGALYNFYAVENIHGLAPVGWHVPTDVDWGDLITYLGGYLVAGGHLKEIGITNWVAPNAGADNSTGFTGLPAGIRYGLDGTFHYGYDGAFANHAQGTFCCTLEYSPGYVIAPYLQAANPYMNPGTSSVTQQGSSLRCIMDGVNPTDPGIVTDVDGNNYPTVKIGTQVWMASNFACTKYRDGTPITNITNDAAWAALTTEAYCWYNNIPS